MAAQSTTKSRSIWDPQIVKRAIWDSFRKLDPRIMAKNPVMLVVEVGLVRIHPGGEGGLDLDEAVGVLLLGAFPPPRG